MRGLKFARLRRGNSHTSPLTPHSLRKLAVAMLVFLARAAGAGVVAADLGGGADRLRRLCLGVVDLAQRLVEVGVVVLDVLHVGVRRGLLDLFRRADLHRHQQAAHIRAHAAEQALEQFEGLALVFLLRVLLRSEERRVGKECRL